MNIYQREIYFISHVNNTLFKAVVFTFKNLLIICIEIEKEIKNNIENVLHLYSVLE